MNTKFYLELIKYQEELKKESERIIIDTGTRFKYHTMASYHLLTYIINLTPWIISQIQTIDGSGMLSSEDPEWFRDSHIILVKRRCGLKEETLKRVVDIVGQNIQQTEILKLLKVMITRFRNTIDDDAQELLETLKGYYRQLKKQNNNYDIIANTLELWMGNEIVGPFSITRTLAAEYYCEPFNYPRDPLTAKIQEKSEGFSDYESNYITVLDDTAYIIDHDEAEELHWPDEINVEFVAIAEDRAVNSVESNTVKLIESHHINLNIKDDSTKYEFTVDQVINMDHEIISVKYGAGVFLGIDNKMLSILQTTAFVNWTKSQDVNLELWFGRNEIAKLKDIEAVKNRVKQLEQELARLKRSNINNK